MSSGRIDPRFTFGGTSSAKKRLFITSFLSHLNCLQPNGMDNSFDLRLDLFRNSSARLMRHALLDRFHRSFRSVEKGPRINTHINHQCEQRSDESDLAPA